MNLISDRWIQVRRASERRERIAPWQITEDHENDPIIALDSPRPDFNGALMQFFIGLLQTAAPPDETTGVDWVDWLENPPKPNDLKERFEHYIDAFNMDGDGPRFMQDVDELEGEAPIPIAALLIDAPGANTLKQNADHFIKRDRAEALCPSCAAIALFTLQTNAPLGGAGYRTSLRGGGPLTTLVILDPTGSRLDETLWRNVWLNVLQRNEFEASPGNANKNRTSDIFPWFASCRTSEKETGCDTTPEDVHPLQMYWGTPRRIRLDWSFAKTGTCNICGENSNRLLSQYVTKNYGVNYSGPWQHPLTPHSLDKEGHPIPFHPQPGGISYKYWLSFIEKNEHGVPPTVPAKVVEIYRKRKPPGVVLRLFAFGYDMDNMKARCWYESSFPLYLVPEAWRNDFAERVRALIDSAALAASYLRGSIMEAWFRETRDIRGDTSFLREIFFHHTESEFYAHVNRLKTTLEQNGDDHAVLSNWHSVLRRACLTLFDYWAAQGDAAFLDLQKIARARHSLMGKLYGKKLSNLLGTTRTKEKTA